jgi:hypothetical protein
VDSTNPAKTALSFSLVVIGATTEQPPIGTRVWKAPLGGLPAPGPHIGSERFAGELMSAAHCRMGTVITGRGLGRKIQGLGVLAR